MESKRSAIHSLMKCNSPQSPSEVNTAKHIVLVMDGMKEFKTESLEWVLENIIDHGSIVTLLGTMPWLNIPLSFKVWLDVWPVKIDNYSNLNQHEWNLGDAKYQKLHEVIQLCKRHGVVLEKKIVMGYPLKLHVVEKISGLHPTIVVLDRNQKKARRFYEKKVPCNMVMMRRDGEVEIIKSTRDDQQCIMPESPSCWFSTLKLQRKNNEQDLSRGCNDKP